MKKMLMIVLCAIVSGIVACDGVNRTDEIDAIEALDEAFIAVLEKDNYTYNMQADGGPTEPNVTMHVQREGNTMYFLMTVEDETEEAYYFTELGQRVRYGRDDLEGIWLRQEAPNEIDPIAPMLMWEANDFVYEDGAYALHDEAFETFFGKDIGRDEASYTVVLDHGAFTITITQDFSGDVATMVHTFTHIGTTQITIPDFPEPTQHTVTFETHSEDTIEPVILDAGSSLAQFIPRRDGYVFMGWYQDQTYEKRIRNIVQEDITVHAKWLEWLVQVGELNQEYTVPIGTQDEDTATVLGGYWMARVPTTYALWYEVRTWAEAHGYHFENLGREGSQGEIGETPTEHRRHPVTRVSWRDAIVWLNALSEMHALEPVYRDANNQVIRDAREDNAEVVDGAIQTENNGYRLPTNHEWEMAARWKIDTESTDGSILVGGRYWTPGNYASGATADYQHFNATREVAWYRANSGGQTQPVGELLPNHLGLYDMSGQVTEWTYTKQKASQDTRGGSHFSYEDRLKIGHINSRSLSHNIFGGNVLGFRIVRNP